MNRLYVSDQHHYIRCDLITLNRTTWTAIGSGSVEYFMEHIENSECRRLSTPIKCCSGFFVQSWYISDINILRMYMLNPWLQGQRHLEHKYLEMRWTRTLLFDKIENNSLSTMVVHFFCWFSSTVRNLIYIVICCKISLHKLIDCQKNIANIIQSDWLNKLMRKKLISVNCFHLQGSC